MEIIKLNLIPSGVNPTCHCSQYDNGRVIRIDLFDGLTPYVLQSGDTVTLNVRKPDNTIIEASLTATQGNTYVNLVTTEQMCACVGYNLCDLTITNGSTVIGTLNFIMQVERDVLADGIPSQSVIEDLNALVQEAVGDNFYTKSEVDTALDEKADKSTTYTKTQVDSALALKASVNEVDNIRNVLENMQLVGDEVNPEYVSGYITGSGTFGNGECRTNFLQFSDQYIVVIPLTDYKCRIAEYSSQSVGTFTKFIAQDRITTPLEFTPDPQKYYVIDVLSVSGAAVSPSTIPYNAITYYSINNTDESLTLRGKAADAKAVGDKLSELSSKSIFNLRSPQRSNVIFDMQSGHGFYNPLSVGNAPSDDTTDYIFGSQSVFFDYAGQADFSSPLDLADKVLQIKLKIDSISTGASVDMYLSDVSSMTSNRVYTLYRQTPSNQFETGIWADVAINVALGRVNGTPDLTKTKYIRFSVSNGSATYHIQSVGYREKGSQKPCISFTFDDGWSEVMTGAKILGKYNIPATAYIFVGCQLTLAQLQSLKNDYNWDIELHGDSVFTEMTPSDITTYLQELKDFIQNNGLGYGDHLAYPGGQNNTTVINTIRKFCKTARTVNVSSAVVETIPPAMSYNLRAVSGVGSSGESVANIKSYIDKVVQSNGWLILVFHRIGDTQTSMFCSEADLDEIARYAVASGAEIKTVASAWERN